MGDVRPYGVVLEGFGGRYFYTTYGTKDYFKKYYKSIKERGLLKIIVEDISLECARRICERHNKKINL